jgi:hypothetical protein
MFEVKKIVNRAFGPMYIFSCLLYTILTRKKLNLKIKPEKIVKIEMSAQNVFVVNCESAEGTQVVGVYLTEKLGRAAAKNYVEEYYEENVMKGKKGKSEDGRKVLYAEAEKSGGAIVGEKITITEVACEMPVAKGKKAKKDPKAPKKGLSAYMIFAKENRERIKTENPDADFGAMGKLIGDAWKELDETEKATFKAKSETDKKRYETEIADYTPEEPEVKVKKVKKAVEPKAEKAKKTVEKIKKIVKKAVKEAEASEAEESDSEVEVPVKPKVKKAVKKVEVSEAEDSEVQVKPKVKKAVKKVEVSEAEDSEVEVEVPVKPKVKKTVKKAEPTIEISDVSDSEVEVEVTPKKAKVAKA